MPGSKALESLKVWENICRSLHPFGQRDGESRERGEDVETVWLHKVEYNIGVTKVHICEVRCGGCNDFSHEGFKKAAKITALEQGEDLEVFQRWQNLKCLIFSESWE